MKTYSQCNIRLPGITGRYVVLAAIRLRYAVLYTKVVLSHIVINNHPLHDMVDAVSFPTLLLTFSLCCLLRKWTAKFSALSAGPGVYSFPGQSVQRIRGRNIHLTFGGVVPAGGGGVIMISVSA